MAGIMTPHSARMLPPTPLNQQSRPRHTGESESDMGSEDVDGGAPCLRTWCEHSLSCLLTDRAAVRRADYGRTSVRLVPTATSIDFPSVTVDRHNLAVLNYFGGVHSSHYRWDTIFPRNDRAVRQQAAAIGDDSARDGQQR